MKRFEYNTVDIQTTADVYDVDDVCNTVGNDGWELVAVTRVETQTTFHRCYFKREKDPS